MGADVAQEAQRVTPDLADEEASEMPASVIRALALAVPCMK